MKLDQDTKDFLAKHLQLDCRWNPSDMRCKHGPSVWSIVNYFFGIAKANIKEVMDAYDLSEDEVRAALIYYWCYKPFIDAEIILQQEAWGYWEEV